VFKVYKEDMFTLDLLLYYTHIVDFQNEYGVVKYRNVDELLLSYQVERTPRALIGYRNSLLYKVINKKFPKKLEGQVETTSDTKLFRNITNSTVSNLLIDEEYLDYESVYDYTCNYSSAIMLRKNPYSRFKQETMPVSVCSNVKESPFQEVDKYTVQNGLFKKIFDCYMGDSKDLVDELFKMSDYQLLELSFDDYLCIPAILKIIDLYKISNNYNWFTDNLTS
ncbi:MAG: hypothetical protein ACRCX2_27700, partial [Paraclostridium sp.]